MSEPVVEVQTAETSNEQAATEAASIAAIGAVVASETAAQAEETANVALEETAETQAAVLAVAAEVEQTREAAGEAIQAVADGTVSRQEFETFRAEMASVRQHYADMEAQRVAAEQSQGQVQEVSVENGIAGGTAGGPGNGNSGLDTGGSESSAPQRRAGLRHRGRR